MNRYQFEDLISDYIENKIKPKDKIEFEKYVENNIEAKALLDSIRNNIDQMNDSFKIQVGKYFDEDLLLKIKNQSQKKEKLRSSNTFLFGFNLSQLTVMVGLLILFLFATFELNNEYKINNFEDNIFSAEDIQKTSDGIVENHRNEKEDTTTINKQINKDFDYSKKIKFVND